MDAHPMDGDMPAAACDSEAARLLPWHLTGRLAAADAARVAQHLGQCATCRADYESQRALRERLRDDGPLEYAPQAGLAATLARIDELGRELAAPARASSSPAGVELPAPARRAARTGAHHSGWPRQSSCRPSASACSARCCTRAALPRPATKPCRRQWPMRLAGSFAPCSQPT